MYQLLFGNGRAAPLLETQSGSCSLQITAPPVYTIELLIQEGILPRPGEKDDRFPDRCKMHLLARIY